ncbi:MAG: PEGA domain-containing protein [Bacteroidales bacterium]|nr:PEGA domain-containing protein [Bacteroidales bacterium]
MRVLYCQKMLNLVGCSIDCNNMKTILRHLIILALFACALSISASAQGGSSLTLDGSSFRLEQTDALGGVNIDPIGKDRSNRACFRLKISLNRMTPEDIAKVSVVPVGGNIVLMRSEVAASQNGIIVEMTARPEVRLYIKHPTLGQSNVVTINPEGNKVYLLNGWADQRHTLVVFCAKSGADVYLDGTFRGKIGADNMLNVPDVTTGLHTLKVQSDEDVTEQQIDVNVNKVSFNVELKSAAHLQQFVVFNVTPADALLVFDGTPIVVTAGTANKRVKFGTYSYTVSAKDYHSYSGTVTVNDMRNKAMVNVTLQPSHGWISVGGSSAEGAFVYIDDELIGQAPLKSDRLSSGTYSLKLVKPLYKSHETTVTVTDGNVTAISPVLQADFATVTFTVGGNAEIWVDGELKGRSSWTGDLASGSYLVECRSEWHRSTSDNINVSADMPSKRITLKAPTPIYGSLSITSSPDISEVYLDGAYMGQTPLYLPETIIGSHTLKLSKSGCADWTGNVNVSEGQIAEVNATLQSGAPVTFKSNAPDAQLYVDGTLIGSANGTYDLSVGSHDVICKAPGKKDLSKTINVSASDSDIIVDCRFGAPKTIIVNGVSFDMIMVEGGTFTMGATSEQGSDAESDEKPAHQVTLSDYYIGETEVTQALWKAVMGKNPSHFEGNSNPVENVSWNDCQKFIRKLNSLTGHTFRLPTEAEWEYAARGGKESKGYKYSGGNNINDVAWYSDNSSFEIHAVKTKSPNELGLYDMSGNVYEWCNDWHGSYSSSSQTNPTGPASGAFRVLRGGSWYYLARLCRVSFRTSILPDYWSDYFGLRLVLVP